jgi:ketosteroid isomerase-like protein
MKMNFRSGAICGIVLAAAVAAASAQSNVRPTIEATNTKFGAALAAGKPADLAALYTTDAMAFPPGSDIVRGRDAIQKMWQGVIDSGVKSAELTTTEVDSQGTVAHEVGNYAMKDGAGKVLDRGKYVVIWKRDGAAWRIHRDIWNSSMPAAR